MTRFRLLAALPLAALVAVLAHAVGFGADHAAGGTAAHGLDVALAAALALCALVAIFAAALRGPHPSIATERLPRYLWCFLAAGGFAAYAAIELAEGHGIATGARALLAIVPTALTVDLAARFFARRCANAGDALAAIAALVRHRTIAPFRAPVAVPIRATDRAVGRARRGRAPPPHR